MVGQSQLIPVIEYTKNKNLSFHTPFKKKLSWRNNEFLEPPEGVKIKTLTHRNKINEPAYCVSFDTNHAVRFTVYSDTSGVIFLSPII